MGFNSVVTDLNSKQKQVALPEQNEFSFHLKHLMKNYILKDNFLSGLDLSRLAATCQFMREEIYTKNKNTWNERLNDLSVDEILSKFRPDLSPVVVYRYLANQLEKISKDTTLEKGAINKAMKYFLMKKLINDKLALNKENLSEGKKTFTLKVDLLNPRQIDPRFKVENISREVSLSEVEWDDDGYKLRLKWIAPNDNPFLVLKSNNWGEKNQNNDEK